MEILKKSENYGLYTNILLQAIHQILTAATSYIARDDAKHLIDDFDAIGLLDSSKNEASIYVKV